MKLVPSEFEFNLNCESKTKSKRMRPLAKKNKLYSCDMDDCNYSSPKKSNVVRHTKETHFGDKKTCVCGKRYTSSSLSRHKRDDICPGPNPTAVEPKNPIVTNDDKIGIDTSLVTDIEEHTMKIEVLKMIDGTVLFRYKNFCYENKEYVLQPLEKVLTVENATREPIECDGPTIDPACYGFKEYVQQPIDNDLQPIECDEKMIDPARAS